MIDVKDAEISIVYQNYLLSIVRQLLQFTNKKVSATHERHVQNYNKTGAFNYMFSIDHEFLRILLFKLQH